MPRTRNPNCSKCDKPKDGSHGSYCKACLNEYAKERRASNPEKFKAYDREWRTRTPERHAKQMTSAQRWRERNPEMYRASLRHNRVQRKFGITLRQYEERLAAQNGECSICGTQEDVMYLDHDHSTGALRDFLCSRCNIGLGQFRDNPELLIQAAAYLERHSAEKAV